MWEGQVGRSVRFPSVQEQDTDSKTDGGRQVHKNGPVYTGNNVSTKSAASRSVLSHLEIARRTHNSRFRATEEQLARVQVKR